MAAAAVSISGSGTCCYPTMAARGGGQRRRTTVIRSSFAPPSSPSSSPPSTTLQIGCKWAELQGSHDWDGLLRPLDGALRGELVRYGEFVRAAYASFSSSSSSGGSGGSCRFPRNSLLRRAGLPSTGYRVTRLLHAAASASVHPRWLPSSSSSSSSSYIGFVAVCDDEAEIERLGRRDVVVAFRGTATCGEWVDNFSSGLTRIPIPTITGAGGEEEDDEAMVESGFWRLFTAPGEAHSSLQEQVRDEAQRIADEYGCHGEPPVSITVTGHSLGAALAVLAAHEIATATATTQEKSSPAKMMVTAVSFGGPRVGNAAFRRRMERSGGKVLRVVNADDIVTKVPGFFPVHDDGEPLATAKKERMKKASSWVPMRWLVDKMGWAYTDVGRELRLSSSGGGGQANVNVVASHDLDLYLKLVASCTD